MLTAELVNARRRGADLVLAKMNDETRALAESVARSLVDLFRTSVGATRDDVDAALAAVEVPARHQRLKDGLAKLLDDRADWNVVGDLDPERVRREVFQRATVLRRSLAAGISFDRERVLGDVARELGVDAPRVERALFADLRGASVLAGFDAISPRGLVDVYERSQAQAVLLRAVKIRVAVRCASPRAARAVFRRLKFLGLLHTITPAPPGYEIAIDGPLSLFESVTKYGQKMALVVPVLECCEAWSLEADVRWGKARTPLTFRAASERHREGVPDAVDEPAMPDDIAAFAAAFSELGSQWKVAASHAVLDLPGVGLSIPDLVFTRGKERVYFEVLGFWSREAVFRRVDLVERGLSERVLFAVSSRLRVSEEVLADDAAGALYVYKGTMSPRAVKTKLDRLSHTVSAIA